MLKSQACVGTVLCMFHRNHMQSGATQGAEKCSRSMHMCSAPQKVACKPAYPGFTHPGACSKACFLWVLAGFPEYSFPAVTPFCPWPLVILGTCMSHAAPFQSSSFRERVFVWGIRAGACMLGRSLGERVKHCGLQLLFHNCTCGV